MLWDPCAAVFRDGRYHLFYLHDSWAAAGPSKRSDGYNYKAWAHVSSADLVHWQRHPDAIARGQTGNLFDWNGTPAIVFPHPDGGGASCFASNPEGDLERWRFDPRGAVLRHPAQGNSLYPSNNDVTAWQEGDWCYVLTGTRDQRHGGDAQHLFRSRNPLAQGASHGDTAAWEYVHQFYRSRREWTDANDDCACPDFFRIGSGEAAKWMLLHFCHNAPGGSRYYLGSYRDRRFHPESFDRINWPGGNLHAPRAMLDGHGRRIMFANLNERRPAGELVAVGWSGCMSLPVVLTLDPDGGKVRFAPVDELQALRRDPREWTDVALAAPGVEVAAHTGHAASTGETDRPRPEARGRAALAATVGGAGAGKSEPVAALSETTDAVTRSEGGASPGAGNAEAEAPPPEASGSVEVEVALPEAGDDALEIELEIVAGKRRRLRRQGAVLPGRRRGDRHRAQHRRAGGRDRVRQGEPARRPRLCSLGREAGTAGAERAARVRPRAAGHPAGVRRSLGGGGVRRRRRGRPAVQALPRAAHLPHPPGRRGGETVQPRRQRAGTPRAHLADARRLTKKR